MTITAATIRYLGTQTGISCAATVPHGMRPPHIQVLKTGGRRRDPVSETTQLTILCWASGEAQTERLAQQIRPIIQTITIPDVTVYSVEELGSPIPSPDPDTNQPRYQQTVIITTRNERTPS